jgi:predicted nucleotidyltransferase
VNDADFLDQVADTLAALDGVLAVTLGGSRAQGTHRPDSDWDLAIYYRGHFDPQSLRDVGWPGQVVELGGWGGGVFNGGAWLTINGRQVDVHYRDLDVVEQQLAEAQAGRFQVERLMFHLLGIPTYLVVAELALNRTLRGTLPRPDYPQRLRTEAPKAWWGWASGTFDYAIKNHAALGRTTLAIGLAAQAAAASAHAVLAARGEWITNDKRLLLAAGLDRLDPLFAEATADDVALTAKITAVRDQCAAAVGAA